MKIAVSQCSPQSGGVAGNLARMAERASEAAAAGAALLVCPEMMLTGYNISAAEIRRLAEPAGGRAAERIAAVAAREHIGIVYGYPELGDGAIYNAAQLIGQGGERLANYRKAHLFGDAERAAFTSVSLQPVVIAYQAWNLGLLICYDVEFPEAVRALALAGADLVVVPTALMQPYEAVANVLVPARAFENQVYVAYANYCGREGDLSYCGRSSIAAPSAGAVAHANTEEMLLLGDLSKDTLAHWRALNTYLADRKPSDYGTLTAATDEVS